MCSNAYFQGYRKECFEGLACLQGQWPYDGLTFPDFSHCVMSNFEIHWKMHLVRTCWNQSLKMHLTYQHQCGCSRSSDWLQPLWNLTGHVSDPPTVIPGGWNYSFDCSHCSSHLESLTNWTCIFFKKMDGWPSRPLDLVLSQNSEEKPILVGTIQRFPCRFSMK